MATDLQSMDALFGMTQTGGKPKSRKTAKTTMKKTVTGKKSSKKGGVLPVDINGENIEGQQSFSQQVAPLQYKFTCTQDPQNGGMSKLQYKAYLAKMDVKKLYKIAKGKGVKITKKKDGKTTYIKKDTVIQKLCDAMHSKKK